MAELPPQSKSTSTLHYSLDGVAACLPACLPLLSPAQNKEGRNTSKGGEPVGMSESLSRRGRLLACSLRRARRAPFRLAWRSDFFRNAALGLGVYSLEWFQRPPFLRHNQFSTQSPSNLLLRPPHLPALRWCKVLLVSSSPHLQFPSSITSALATIPYLATRCH